MRIISAGTTSGEGQIIVRTIVGMYEFIVIVVVWYVDGSWIRTDVGAM